MSTTTTKIQMYSNLNNSAVVLKWNTTLSRDLDNQLYDVLGGITGVERVLLRRYSADLEFAPHVTTAEQLMDELRELFAEETGPIASIFGGPVVAA